MSTTESITKKCQLGTYSFDMATNCTTCPAGSFCPDPNDVYAQNLDCNGIEGANICDCPKGTYSNDGAIYCTNCDAGYFCGTNETEANPTGQECPIGVLLSCWY